MTRITALLLLAFAGNAVASVDINRLKSLINTGQAEQAYSYAASEVSRYEGDPVFDYYYGIAAIDSGHASEGVFALERVLLTEPNNHAARLELARGYYILEEYARSRQEFNTVLEVSPPEEVRDRIYAYLDAIRLQEGRYATTSTTYFEFGVGTDTNVNSGADNPNFVILGDTTSLNSSALETDDSFYRFAAHYGVNTPITAGVSLLASITGDWRVNQEESEFDTAVYNGNAGVQFLHAQDAYNLGLIVQQFNLDGEDYRQLIGLNTNWRRHLTQLSTLQAFVQFTQQEYDDQPTRNADTLTLGAGYTKRFNTVLRPVLFGNVYFAQDAAENELSKAIAERDYFGLRAGAIISTSSKTSLQFSASFQNSEYGDVDFSSGLVRDEDFIYTSVDFTWLLNRHWSLLSNLSYSKNASNVDVYQYDRAQLGINLRYEMR